MTGPITFQLDVEARTEMYGLVSIILPVYNGELYLREAIDSVLTQTYGKWELIVVDDGSFDGTAAILSTYTDPRIVNTRQENRGEAGARNTGLKLAKGEYVAFLDADDLYMNSAIADLVSYLAAHQDIDVVFSDGYFCDKSGCPLMLLSEHRPGPYTGAILEQLVLSPSVVSVPCSTMFRRLSAEIQGIQFDAQLKYGVDWDFWLQMARYYHFGYLPKLTCKYRVHGDNMTSAATWKQRKSDLFAGRYKILQSSWFGDLSVPTQRAFFYYVLVDLLSDEPIMQETMLATPQFRSLPPPDRADLFRAVATADIVKHRDIGRIKANLNNALLAWPEDRKSQALLALSNVSAGSCRAAIRSWSALRLGFRAVQPIKQRSPKPVPSALLPRA